MASRPKRRRTKTPSSSATTSSVEHTPSQPGPSTPSPADVSAIFKTCMAQVMPSIEDTFKQCMDDYFQQTQSTSASSARANLLQPPSTPPVPSLLQELTGDTQQGSSGTNDSPISDTLPNALSAKSAIHLTLGIDQKIRNKIHSGEFIKFSSLLKPAEADTDSKTSYHSVDKDGQLVFVKATDKPTVNSLAKWTECFHIFVAIYSEKYPLEVPNLMAYAQTIQNISRSCGDRAAINYDERFRLWRQQDTDSCPWQQKNIELFQEAMVQGLEFKMKSKSQPFRGPQAKHKYCFAYNNNGSCPRGSSCPHPHVCQYCAAKHHRGHCPSKPKSNRKANGKPTNASNKPLPPFTKP